MKNDILATAASLTDQALLGRLPVLVSREREALVELIAHLAELDTRECLYAAEGYGSLFTYCTRVLRLSEDAAYNRKEAARACRRFPVILDLLASGSVTLTAVRLLGRHLTAENHRKVLAQASGRTKGEIEALVAQLAPRPDVPSSVRRLPEVARNAAPAPPPAATLPSLDAPRRADGLASRMETPPEAAAGPSPPAAWPLPSRPVVQATAPERYRVQFTVGRETHEKLRRLQDLLRREIPDGDPGAIFDRALTLLLEKVEKAKLAATSKPRRPRPTRSGTGEKSKENGSFSRHIPAAVRRAVWRRDGSHCAFVAANGSRCPERTFLELHHVQPYARRGPATVANISVRCRRHNQYEAELIFGPYGASVARESPVWTAETRMT